VGFGKRISEIMEKLVKKLFGVAVIERNFTRVM
jgi:hypothetical protein